MDWPDAIWTLIAEQPDPGSDRLPTRFLFAPGRDVSLAESALTFDPITLRLSIAEVGSGRALAKRTHVRDFMLAEVAEMPGQNSNAIA
jgi:hypothetical protein